MRALGLDLGGRRIGVAVSDRSGTVASPLDVILRTGSRQRDHDRIARLVADEDAEVIVVGLPLSMDGRLGPAAKAALAEVRVLGSVVGVPVLTHDERLTTVTAERSLREAGLDGRARRKVVDKVAAAVMLQAWLDSPARWEPT
ncbi:MAG: Holliday junction resolvase RuvX [Acidimicrobiia bacterium]|nr:Holliday junction resolvase RuvX [Acidimicrobiia bacterium]MBA3983141.1 Holliday junction resolvase RuvX [Acidimicrobiia bacterium]